MKLKIIVLALIVSSVQCDAKSVDIYNESDIDLPKAAISVHGLTGSCNDIWNPNILPAKTGHYREEVGIGCCHDWFSVYGDKYYIPTCPISGPTIRIKNDGIYINDSLAGIYGDVKAVFKNFGGKFGACMEVAALGTELAAKLAAQKTFLASSVSDAALDASEQAAIQPLIGARKAAEQLLQTAQTILSTSNSIAAGAIDAANKTASGIFQAGEVISIGVLTAADQTTQIILQGVLDTFNIEQLRYEGSLQQVVSGNLGNVQCKAVIAKQKIGFNFDLSIQDSIASIEKLAHTIADKIIDQAKKSALKAAKALHAGTRYQLDDLIKLTLWHHTKKEMPLELTLNEEIV